MRMDLYFWALLGIPLLTGLCCQLFRSVRSMFKVMFAGVLLDSMIVGILFVKILCLGKVFAVNHWFFIDSLSLIHLIIMAIVFTISSGIAIGYFCDESAEKPLPLRHAKIYAALWCATLMAMTLVLISNSLGLMWVGVEATTILTAFLISLDRTSSSIEAMWKYLMICSVGIAFALLGTMFTASAGNGLAIANPRGMFWTEFYQVAKLLDPMTMKIAFVFLLVGYGTKAGLAPMHTWLPDAHSQAPGPVSALFSGFMLNMALYAIMRYLPLVEAATGNVGWAHHLLAFFGLFSILIAAAFIIYQHDIKRLLAYHSVEHLGIIAVGLGIGGWGTYAALFHSLNHAICKTTAFLCAGRLGQIFKTHDMRDLKGALHTSPLWGLGFLGSMLALIGVAPFAIFMSEFQIIQAAINQGDFWLLCIFLIGTGVVFVSAFEHTISVVWGVPEGNRPSSVKGRISDWLMIFGALVLLFVLGLWMPAALDHTLRAAAAIVGGK